MYVVTVARKPLDQSTVAANVLEHGSGALAIDAVRVGSGLRIQSAAGGLGDGVIYGTADEYQLGTGRAYRVGGRWPTNLLLEHRPGCRRDGTKRVRASVNHHVSQVRFAGAHGTYGKGAGGVGHDYADADGKETVASWVCDPDCPVGFGDEARFFRQVQGSV